MEDQGVGLQDREQPSAILAESEAAPAMDAQALEADRARALEEKLKRKQAAERKRKRKIRRKRLITLLVVLVIAGGIAYGMYQLLHEEEPERTVWSLSLIHI